MSLPNYIHEAIYQKTGIDQYDNNPLIEALPPLLSISQVRQGITGNIKFESKDIFTDGNHRAHLLAQLFNNFFQPLSRHLELQTKLSITIRQGYVGRNLDNGTLNMHLQNGYERVMTGDLGVFRFAQAKSTALSFTLIGCSGSGKTTTLNRILATYPQVIFHEQYNFTQIVYLKLDCPHDGSLKNLCNHFFRAIDAVLHTNYEKQYALKRHTVETLLALMGQIANEHAIGVLVIDEIQHLSLNDAGGTEKMLNFFVTLVNVIGLPVIMVGTPKARIIFEKNMRSARRSAGFGALLWEPMQQTERKKDRVTGELSPTEWTAFTDKLWQYQWLQKRDEILSEEIRACWYDLSQGVLDIVVKLFILAQLRAIATRTERITVQLLKKVYQDELKPVHPMISALRSGDSELIMQYSDLTIPDMDKKILSMTQRIIEAQPQYPTAIQKLEHNPDAKRLYTLLKSVGCQSDLVIPLIESALQQHSDLPIHELLQIVLEAYQNVNSTTTNSLTKDSAPKNVNKQIKAESWETLSTDDLRYKYSVSKESLYPSLQTSGLVFDMKKWLDSMSA